MRSVLRVADFYRANRGGGIYSEAVSQRIGAIFAFGAARLGLTPTTVTLAGLCVGLFASASALVGWPGVIALVGWQLAYALDCADGQLARVTGQASPAGARVDVLCDVVSHAALVTALAVVAGAPTWLAALFAGTWMVNIITSTLAGPPVISSGSLLITTLKGVRDYGAIVLAAGLILVVAPTWTIYFVAVMTLVNAAFLILSVLVAARRALAQRDPVGVEQPAGDHAGGV